MSERTLEEIVAPAVLAAAEGAGIGVVVIVVRGDGEAEMLYVNESAVRILGWPREVLETTSAIDRVSPEQREAVKAMARARLAGELPPRSLEVEIVRADGARVPVSTSISAVEIDGRPASVAFFQDVAERRRTEAALVRSEQRLRALIESAPDGIAISRNGVFLFVNRAAATLLGCESASELVGRNMREILWDDDEDRAFVDRSSRRASGQTLGARIYKGRRKDGAQLRVEISAHVIDWDGAPALLGFARDITERERMREQLARTDRLAALGTMAAGVAHEINNPLAFLKLAAERLERLLSRAAIDETVKGESLHTLAHIAEGAERVAEIVRDLRAFSRTDEARIGPVDLGAVISSAERMTAHTLRGRATLRSEPVPRLRVLAQPGRLEQVLVNLLLNAGQAFEQGASGNVVMVRASAVGEHAVVEVIDNGPGIPPEVLPHVFDPFFTTKREGEGTGLGLSICHAIVAALGGDISVETERGKGTTFRVRLRLAGDGEMATPPPSTRLTERRLRVMVVDDEPRLANALGALLEGHHEARIETMPDAALVAIETGAPLDVVLCDVRMPGIGGVELHRRTCARRPDLARRFVMMTGGTLDEGAADYFKEQGVPVLEKPFSNAVLFTALARAATR